MVLELRNITKNVGAETHIHPTSLTLAPGGFNVLLGATNAGKTSLIKLMAGLEQPSGGDIIMDGAVVTGLSPQRRNISLVHQFFVNYPHLSVYENIASPLRVAGVPRDQIDARVQEAAEILQLTPMLLRKPQELSGGQQQRTALARAIVKDSKLVLLDEPLANLDYKLREELRDQLPALFAGRGAVVVYATSEPSEALMLGGHTATVHAGRVTQFGPTGTLYRRPGDVTTAKVFSDPPLNIAPVRKSGDRITLSENVAWMASGAAARMPDGEYRMGLRPNFVVPADNGGTRMVGRVEITELSGSESVAHFAHDGTTWVSQSDGVHPFSLATDHAFFLDTSQAFYFDADGRLVA